MRRRRLSSSESSELETIALETIFFLPKLPPASSSMAFFFGFFSFFSLGFRSDLSFLLDFLSDFSGRSRRAPPSPPLSPPLSDNISPSSRPLRPPFRLGPLLVASGGGSSIRTAAFILSLYSSLALAASSTFLRRSSSILRCSSI